MSNSNGTDAKHDSSKGDYYTSGSSEPATITATAFRKLEKVRKIKDSTDRNTQLFVGPCDLLLTTIFSVFLVSFFLSLYSRSVITVFLDLILEKNASHIFAANRIVNKTETKINVRLQQIGNRFGRSAGERKIVRREKDVKFP